MEIEVFIFFINIERFKKQYRKWYNLDILINS